MSVIFLILIPLLIIMALIPFAMLVTSINYIIKKKKSLKLAIYYICFGIIYMCCLIFLKQIFANASFLGISLNGIINSLLIQLPLLFLIISAIETVILSFFILPVDYKKLFNFKKTNANNPTQEKKEEKILDTKKETNIDNKLIAEN